MTMFKKPNSGHLGMLFLPYLCYKVFLILLQLICFLLVVLTGNLDWLGNEFTFNTGVGLVISQPEGIEERNYTVVEQLRAAFERDWFSRYTHSLQANKMNVCSTQQINRLVPDKLGHLDNAPMPISVDPHDNGPAPIRHKHQDDGQAHVKTKHHDDRLSKIALQGKADGLEPIIDSYQERGQVKMSHDLDSRQVKIKGNHQDNPMDPPSQSAESSGSREILNGSL